MNVVVLVGTDAEAAALGETARAIRPVVQGEDGEGGIEGGLRKREVLGDGPHDRRCPGRPLPDHLGRGLDGRHAQIGRFVGAGARPHVHDRACVAERGVDGSRDPWIGPARDRVGTADLVVDG